MTLWMTSSLRKKEKETRERERWEKMNAWWTPALIQHHLINIVIKSYYQGNTPEQLKTNVPTGNLATVEKAVPLSGNHIDSRHLYIQFINLQRRRRTASKPLSQVILFKQISFTLCARTSRKIGCRVILAYTEKRGNYRQEVLPVYSKCMSSLSHSNIMYKY